MRTVNIHMAKTHLSRLVEEVIASGESLVIAKAGKPMVTVSPYREPHPEGRRRLGTLTGQVQVPADFDTMYQEEIVKIFESGDEGVLKAGE